MPSLAARYAEALLASTASPAEGDAFGRAVDAYVDAMARHEELREFLYSQVTPAAAKKNVLRQLAAADTPAYVLNLMCLLADKDRLRILADIAQEYHAQKLALRHTLVIEVETALPLTQQEQDAICARFAQQFGAKRTQLRVHQDHSLIGGIRVKIGDTLFDGSLEGQMRTLAQSIHDHGEEAAAAPPPATP